MSSSRQHQRVVRPPERGAQLDARPQHRAGRHHGQDIEPSEEAAGQLVDVRPGRGTLYRDAVLAEAPVGTDGIAP